MGRSISKILQVLESFVLLDFPSNFLEIHWPRADLSRRSLRKRNYRVLTHIFLVLFAVLFNRSNGRSLSYTGHKENRFSSNHPTAAPLKNGIQREALQQIPHKLSGRHTAYLNAVVGGYLLSTNNFISSLIKMSRN